MTAAVLRVLGLAAAIGAASCYHTTLPQDGGGPLRPDGAAADASLPTGGFITADVDGVTIRAEVQAVSYWWSGIQEGWLGGEAQSNDWQWAIVVRNATGPAACLGGYVVLQPVNAPAMGYGTFGGDGACAVDLTAAAPDVGDVLEGTFTATLDQQSGPGVKQVANGSFRLPRVASPP